MRPPRLPFERGWTERAFGSSGLWQRAFSVTLAAASVLATAWMLAALRNATQEEQALDFALRGASLETAQPLNRPKAPAVAPETLRRLDAVAAQLNFPWSQVFDAMERTSSPRVVLLSMEPDAASAGLAISAEARSLEELLVYASALSKDPAIADVRLSQHEANGQDKSRAVRLSLVAGLASRRP